MKLHNNNKYPERTNRTVAWHDSEMFKIGFPQSGLVIRCIYEKINGVKYIRLPGDPVPRTMSQIKKAGCLIAKPAQDRL